MQYLHYLAGPLIGAAIGYFTNFIAVKMLFHPHHPVKVFGKTLPFTPGVIPKNKPRLAHAIAVAVSDILLTKQDIAGLITDEAVNSASTALVADSGLFSQKSPEELAQSMGMEELDTDAMELFLTDKVWDGIKAMDIGSIVATKANEVIRTVPMLALLPVGNIISTIKEKINEYIDSDECHEVIWSMVLVKVDEIKHAPMADTISALGMTETAAEGLIASTMHGALNKYMAPMLDMLNIEKIVEDKINDMDIQVFEDLVMSVMKNELNTIVNLGFVIGLIIGTINIFL